jgi:putative ABC transport system permease protein
MFALAALRIACRALARNRLRTALTTLGITVGIAAVLCTVALGEGSAAQVHEQLLGLGESFVWIEDGGRNASGVRTSVGDAKKLTAEDMKAIVQEVPEIARCSPVADSRAQIIYGNHNWNTTYRGVSEDYLAVRRWPVALGTAFSDADVTAYAKVVVLAKTVADQLFGEGENPVDQVVRIGPQLFKVLGVLQPKGASANGNDDDVVLIPYTTAQRYLLRRTWVDDGMCSATSDAMVPIAQAHIVDVMRVRHRIFEGQLDDFNIRSPDEQIRLREDAARSMGVMLAGIASVSLLVGGVGVMNIMLVSVTERTREIGLRMALGARERDVQWQFLAEALVLGLIGGAMGVGVGFLASSVVTESVGWPVVISTRTILVAVAFALSVGLIFGFYPARQAARLDPIDALRAE